jgi:mannose-6-phosphate isomerase-like protein (cupin superfamily)
MINNLRFGTTAHRAPVSRLKLHFAAHALLSEANALDGMEWVQHFNTGYHDGGWRGIALRAVDGEADKLYSDPLRKTAITDTPILTNCNAIRAALSAFQCPLRSVRLLRLAPGSFIREHRDDDLRIELGEARLHIPLVTHPLVEFYVDGERVIMEEGECWYLDLSRPHRVRNPSPLERIHLVIDCEVNDWLRAQIADGDVPVRHAATPSGQDQFFAFREIVWRDDKLQRAMMVVTDKQQFISEVVRLGATHGFAFSANDVEAIMQRGHQEWVSQWMM